MLDTVMKENIETLYDASGLWRVTIFRRANGTYGVLWEEYSSDPDEECWIPCMRRSESFFDTLETARREAIGRLKSSVPNP